MGDTDIVEGEARGRGIGIEVVVGKGGGCEAEAVLERLLVVRFEVLDEERERGGNPSRTSGPWTLPSADPRETLELREAAGGECAPAPEGAPLVTCEGRLTPGSR